MEKTKGAIKMSFKKAEIETLVELANRLDAEDKIDQAMVVDAAIAKLIKSAAEEEEEEKGKGPRQLSNKAKSKIRQVCKAADSFIQADLDVRGEHKKHLRKLEALCEEICEIAATLKLDDTKED